MFRALFVFAAWRLLGGGGTLLTLLLQLEDLKRRPPLPPLPLALWPDQPGACWMTRWLLVFRGRDGSGRRCRVTLFTDQLAASDYARLRRLLLRLQSAQPLTATDRFDLL